MSVDAAGLKRPRIVSAVWLALWAALAAWTCHALAIAWPYVQLHPQFLLLFALPGLLFQSASLAHLQFVRRPLAGRRRLAARVAAVAGGIVLAGQLWTAMDGISMARFERALAPLVAQVHANAAAPCPPAARYTFDAALAAYLDESNAVRAPIELKYDPKRFVLALGGRSMDIDGSTMFYDSAARRWQKVHNDRLQQTGELARLTDGLAECKLLLRP